MFLINRLLYSTKQEAAHTQSAVSTCYTLWHFGDWSLSTGRGGGYKSKWASEVLPLQKGGGAEKDLAVLKGGHTKF